MPDQAPQLGSSPSAPATVPATGAATGAATRLPGDAAAGPPNRTDAEARPDSAQVRPELAPPLPQAQPLVSTQLQERLLRLPQDPRTPWVDQRRPWWQDLGWVGVAALATAMVLVGVVYTLGSTSAHNADALAARLRPATTIKESAAPRWVPPPPCSATLIEGGPQWERLQAQCGSTKLDVVVSFNAVPDPASPWQRRAVGTHWVWDGPGATFVRTGAAALVIRPLAPSTGAEVEQFVGRLPLPEPESFWQQLDRGYRVLTDAD